MSAAARKRNRVWTAGLLVLLLAAGGTLLNACSATESGPGTRKVYDFTLPTLDHGRFYLNQSKGSVVVLCFWSTTCRHCHAQMTAMGPLMERYANRPVQVAAVCTDPENQTAIRRFAAATGITCPIPLDAGARIFKRFGGLGLPTTVILDQEGVQRLVRSGFSDAILKQIETQIVRLLDESGTS
mgnify:CR=1 FL=1